MKLDGAEENYWETRYLTKPPFPSRRRIRRTSALLEENEQWIIGNDDDAIG